MICPDDVSSHPRLGVGSPVTPTDHRYDQYQGTITQMDGPWARVAWTTPICHETLEWRASLHAIP
jgi:hypothetical protein